MSNTCCDAEPMEDFPSDAHFFASSEGSRGKISIDWMTFFAAHKQLLQIVSHAVPQPSFLRALPRRSFFPKGEVLSFTARARNGVILRGLCWMYE